MDDRAIRESILGLFHRGLPAGMNASRLPMAQRNVKRECGLTHPAGIQKKLDTQTAVGLSFVY